VNRPLLPSRRSWFHRGEFADTPGAKFVPLMAVIGLLTMAGLSAHRTSGGTVLVVSSLIVRTITARAIFRQLRQTHPLSLHRSAEQLQAMKRTCAPRQVLGVLWPRIGAVGGDGARDDERNAPTRCIWPTLVTSGPPVTSPRLCGMPASPYAQRPPPLSATNGRDDWRGVAPQGRPRNDHTTWCPRYVHSKVN